MSWYSKVVWSEGMFLRPQHFQQQDRYLEAFVRQSRGPLRPYDWGLVELALDREALALGKMAVTSAKGLLPDGTPFSIPEHDPPPTPLTIDAGVRDTRVMLALPLRRTGMADVEPVSYTHLDVYKRQPPRSGRRRSPASHRHAVKLWPAQPRSASP